MSACSCCRLAICFQRMPPISSPTLYEIRKPHGLPPPCCPGSSCEGSIGCWPAARERPSSHRSGLCSPRRRPRIGPISHPPATSSRHLPIPAAAAACSSSSASAAARPRALARSAPSGSTRHELSSERDPDAGSTRGAPPQLGGASLRSCRRAQSAAGALVRGIRRVRPERRLPILSAARQAACTASAPRTPSPTARTPCSIAIARSARVARCSAVSFPGGVRTPALRRVRSVPLRPASETLHNSGPCSGVRPSIERSCDPARRVTVPQWLIRQQTGEAASRSRVTPPKIHSLRRP